jgi:hypothetical protein
MNATKLNENERSNKQASGFYLLASATNTSQNPYWYTRHDSKTDSKSGKQQRTMVNNSEQSSHEKGPKSGTRRHHITTKVGDHERED